jgi:hypothetical protein
MTPRHEIESILGLLAEEQEILEELSDPPSGFELAALREVSEEAERMAQLLVDRIAGAKLTGEVVSSLQRI